MMQNIWKQPRRGRSSDLPSAGLLLRLVIRTQTIRPVRLRCGISTNDDGKSGLQGEVSP